MTGPSSSNGKRTRRRKGDVLDNEASNQPRPASETAFQTVPRRMRRVECPDCGTRFRPEETAGKSALCPGCMTLVRLRRPEAEAPAIEPRQWGKFFSGVLTFPLYEGVFARWLFLSAGCVVTGLTTAMLVWFANAGWVSGVLALRMTWGWATIFTLSYACALCLPIVTETAAGCEVVEDWPDPNWKDWILDMLWVALPTLTAAVVAVVLAAPFGLLGPLWFWLAFGGAMLIAFPIVMLSALQAGSAAVPLTRTVLGSLASHWWAWLLFYAEAALLACLWPGLFLLGFAYQPFAVGALSGPLMAAALLIYARLLGRLGHAIAQHP